MITVDWFRGPTARSAWRRRNVPDWQYGVVVQAVGRSPRQRIGAECERRGPDAVVRGCVDLLNGRVVDEELIVSNGDGRKTEFDLTDAGRTYVTEHADDFARAWEATPGRSETDGAFFESVGKLMGVTQQFHHSATDAQRVAAIAKIDEARRALYLILADSTMCREVTVTAFRAPASPAVSSVAYSREAPDSAVSPAVRASAHADRAGRVRATSVPRSCPCFPKRRRTATA